MSVYDLYVLRTKLAVSFLDTTPQLSSNSTHTFLTHQILSPLSTSLLYQGSINIFIQVNALVIFNPSSHPVTIGGESETIIRCNQPPTTTTPEANRPIVTTPKQQPKWKPSSSNNSHPSQPVMPVCG